MTSMEDSTINPIVERFPDCEDSLAQDLVDDMEWNFGPLIDRETETGIENSQDPFSPQSYKREDSDVKLQNDLQGPHPGGAIFPEHNIQDPNIMSRTVSPIGEFLMSISRSEDSSTIADTPGEAIPVKLPSLETSSSCSTIKEKKNKKPASKSKKRKSQSPKKKKARGMPKRPLSAYNIFFQQERARIYERLNLKNSSPDAQDEDAGKCPPRIGFEELGKTVGKRWRALTVAERKVYEKLAAHEIERYRKEMEIFDESRRKSVFSSCKGQRKLGAGDLDDSRAPQEHISSQGPSLQSVSVHVARGIDRTPTTNSGSSGPSSATSASLVSVASEGSTDTFMAPTSGTQPLVHDWERHSRDPPPSPYAEACPPQPPGVTRASSRSTACYPPGLQVFLYDDKTKCNRKYRVEYTCRRMTQKQADSYIAQFNEYISKYGQPSY